VPLLAELDEWIQDILRGYSWRRIDPVPLAPLRKPIADSCVAIVSTAGLVPPGAHPFDKIGAGGDVSYRVVPADTEVQTLRDYHRSKGFDHTGIARDRNLAFPLDRLRELVDSGEIGRSAPRHISFMGSISEPDGLIEQTAPEAARLLVEDGVDVAILLPS
jgi:D-proline reductase (dithiol) PrdB